MKVHLVAFIAVCLVIGITRADVSHLSSNHAPNSLNSNDDQDYVSINFNKNIASAGNNNNNNKQHKYWWMNTPNSPFSNKQNNQINTRNVLDSQLEQQQNILHNTQQHQNYHQQHQQPREQFTSNNIYAHMTSLSGSPSEVNSLMHDAHSQSNYIARQYSPQSKTPCYGATQVCAPKDACEDGFISEQNLGLVLSQSNECDSQRETCCNIKSDQPQQQQQDDQSEPCADANSACVMARFCYNGFIDQSAEHNAVRSLNGFCYAPEVCCRYSDKRRQAPNYFDNDFAAAEGTSEVLTKEGYVVNVPSNQYLPSFPEPEYNPDDTGASNDDPTKLRPNQPTTQAPAPRPTPAQPTTTQAPYQPPTQRPTQAPQTTTQRAYQPPAPQPTPQRPQPQPQPVTQRPYQPQPNQPRPQVVLQDQAINIVPSACPAAMNCTKEEYCTAIGVISKEPVVLNDFQKSFRVPMTDCMIMPQKELGKCCRDPDYEDPWPIGRSGQYVADELNAVFDSGAYKPDRTRRAPTRGQANQAASNQVITRVSAPVQRVAQTQPQQQQVRPNREIPTQSQYVQQSTNNAQPSVQQATCGVRNYNTQPRGKAPLGTGFGEFTWVAMVILESKKALLCGGTILDKRHVITSANCVNGYRHNDVLIKTGEWRLGFDDPKPFQIVRVQRIINHPQYQKGTINHDIAILQLENDIRYDTHVAPICMDEQQEVNIIPNDNNCVTTGWGKEVLKVHLGNALMQHTAVSPLSQGECQSRLSTSQLGYTSSTVCGVTQQDACQVDPGSALACADASGRYFFKGVLSDDTGCEQSNQVAAYTKADLQWIKNLLANSRPRY